MTAHAYLNFARDPLPPSFTQWGLLDSDGQTVAHRAIHLAIFFDDDRLISFQDDPAVWQLRNGQGAMVLHAAVSHGMTIPESLPLELWHEPDQQGRTAITIAREYDYAHLVAQYEALQLAAGIDVEKAVKSRFRRGVL